MAKAKKVTAKKAVASKSVERRVAVQKEEVVINKEESFSAVIRIPTIMYGYMEVSASGTPEQLMRVHAKFVNAYAALAKTAIVTKDIEVRVAADQKTATAKVVETEEEEAPAPAKQSESRVDEMFKKKGEPEERKAIATMRSKSWIIAEERLKTITDTNALTVLAGQVKKSEKMPEAEKPEFLQLIREKEAELTEMLLN